MATEASIAPASERPASARWLDRVVLGFAVFTLCSHAVVLLRGSATQLMWLVTAVALAGAAWWRWRALRTHSERAIEPSFELLPDDALDRRARIAGGALALTCVGIAFWLDGVWSTYWACLAFFAPALAFAVARRVVTSEPSPAPERVRGALAETFLWLVAAAGVFVTLCLHRDNSDDSFYVNVAVTFVDHPDWGLFSRNTLHGLPGPPPAMYHVASFELLAGMLSYLTTAPPLHVMHLGLGPFAGLLLPLALARVLRIVEPRRWPLLLLAALPLYVMDGTIHFNFGTHGFPRAYQGKAILWSVLLPTTVAYGIELGAAPTRRRALQLAAAQIAGIGLSSTGMWLMPVVACTSVCLPLAFEKKSLRPIGLALAGSIYPIAVALWVRAQIMRDAAPKLDKLASNVAEPTIELVQKAVLYLFGSQQLAIAYGVVLFAAVVLARTRLARRYLVVFTILPLVLFMNPFIYDFVRHNITGKVTGDRGFWLLPLPIAIAICAACVWPLPSPRWPLRHAGVVVAALFIGGFFTTFPTRTNLRFWGVPPELKVKRLPYRATLKVSKQLPEGAFVLADRAVSVHLPLVRQPTMPVMAKESFFSGKERMRRIQLRDAFIEKGQPPLTDERIELLRAELDAYAVRGIILPRRSERTKGMKDFLRGAGFRHVASAGYYRIWTRNVPVSPPLPPKPEPLPGPEEPPPPPASEAIFFRHTP